MKSCTTVGVNDWLLNKFNYANPVWSIIYRVDQYTNTALKMQLSENELSLQLANCKTSMFVFFYTSFASSIAK